MISYRSLREDFPESQDVVPVGKHQALTLYRDVDESEYEALLEEEAEPRVWLVTLFDSKSGMWEETWQSERLTEREAQRVFAELPAELEGGGMIPNAKGDRYRVGRMGPLMEDVGHGRARKVGTDKVFRVRRSGSKVKAVARSGQPDVYQGREIESPTKRYYVWLLNDDNTPVRGEGPYGPMALTPAKYNARIGADHGRHARAVTYGSDPNGATFEVVRIYPASIK